MNRTKIPLFFPVADAIETGPGSINKQALASADQTHIFQIKYHPGLPRRFLLIFLLFALLPGHAQENHRNLTVALPDTNLDLEESLRLLEGKTGLYFSYNPEILDLAEDFTWPQGEYTLGEILRIIKERQDVEFTFIGNQIVFYAPGEEPGLVIPVEERDPNQIRTISGRLLSGIDKTPLEFATIWIPSTWEGTISNASGAFRINLPGPDPPDTIAVSCMGYSSRRLAVNDLRDSLNLILLSPAIIPIQEVVIRRSDPLHLIRQALDKIEDNYDPEPFIETAFYRESVRKNGKYIMVSEAVLEIYKPGGTFKAGEQVRLLKGRKNLDTNETDTVIVKLKGGLQTSFLLDFIRHRPEYLDPEFFQFFNYRMADIVTVQDRSTYAIEFQQKPHTDPPHYLGRIYIDVETMGFRGIEMVVDPQTISRATSAMVIKKPRNMKVRPLSAVYQVSYKSDGQKFYLSMISTDVRFRIRRRRKIFSNEFRTVTEMAVTHLQTEQVQRFRPRETTNTSDIFADLLGGYDPGFWGPYNIITPGESMEEALIRISRLMEKHP